MKCLYADSEGEDEEAADVPAAAPMTPKRTVLKNITNVNLSAAATAAEAVKVLRRKGTETLKTETVQENDHPDVEMTGAHNL